MNSGAAGGMPSGEAGGQVAAGATVSAAEVDRVPEAARERYRKGCRLLAAGQLDQAIRCLHQAALAAPDTPAILERLAEALGQGGETIAALRLYDRVIGLGAASAATWRATAGALCAVGEHAQSVGAYENALRLAGDDAEAHHDLGRALYRLGALDEAIPHLREAARRSDAVVAWVSLATAIPGLPGASPAAILEARQACAAALARHSPPLPAATRRPQGQGRRLRVAYLSAFFHSANYMKPVWGLINHHDREVVDVHLLVDGDRDATPGYRGHPRDRLHRVGRLDNGALWERVQSLGIDVLVDLNAFSATQRLGLFLRPPAPLTVAWFNLYATSGLPGLHAIIGDRSVVRAGEERWFTERVICLPLSYLAFDVTHPVPALCPPPCRQAGHITFGSLVSQYKITAPVLDAWASILRETAPSQLVLANSELRSPHNREDLLQRFRDRGVSAERIRFLPPAPHLEFLGHYNAIDVALDAFPYNGGTTTTEALWQGVPVLTPRGDRWAGRTSESLLRSAGLADFVTADIAGFVEAACRIARDPDTPARLSALRQGLRERLKASPACATDRLARYMERLYRRFCPR